MDTITDVNGVITHVNGMTLRDYFAGQAMACIMHAVHAGNGNPSDVPKLAYRVADLMIEARK